jgi:hypothetical protein
VADNKTLNETVREREGRWEEGEERRGKEKERRGCEKKKKS